MGLFDFFGKSKDSGEDSLPKSDVEKWLTATYAIWSEYCGGSWKYIGGFEKNRSNASMVRGVLRRDWMISKCEEGIEMVEYLISEKQHQEENAKKAAFDYGCACNICGRMYLGGYMTKEETIQISAKIGKIIQEQYHSWDEFCKSYIEGTKMESGVAAETEKFIAIYDRLASIQDGPYNLEWNLQL